MVGSISAVSRVQSLILSEDSLVSLTARTKVDSLLHGPSLCPHAMRRRSVAWQTNKQRLYMKQTTPKRERREESPFGGMSAGSISRTAAVNRALEVHLSFARVFDGDERNLHNRRFMSPARRTQHFARSVIVRPSLCESSYVWLSVKGMRGNIAKVRIIIIHRHENLRVRSQ